MIYSMNNALLLILIIMGNLSLYWLFFGKKKLEQKMQKEEDVNGG
jgi:hypothetical protein